MILSLIRNEAPLNFPSDDIDCRPFDEEIMNSNEEQSQPISERYPLRVIALWGVATLARSHMRLEIRLKLFSS